MLAIQSANIRRMRETCFTGLFSVSKRESNLWTTFLLPKSYVGNVGYVGYRFKLARKHTALAMTGSYCHYDNTYRTSFSSVKIIANIANKKLKAASSLAFHVGVSCRKNSKQSNNPSDKLAGKINAKESLTMQNNVVQWFSATQ